MKRMCPALLLLCALALSAAAQTPQLISYQGRLLDGTGLAQGQVEMVFGIYTNSSGGDLLYADTQTVLVADGLYSVLIGASNTAPDALSSALSHDPCYIGVSVAGTPLLPRERVACVAYALHPDGYSLDASDGDPGDALFVDSAGRVGIGTMNPAASAALEIDSSSGALLLPRLTTAERDALTAETGMLIYNKDADTFQGYAVAPDIVLDVAIDDTNKTTGYTVSDIWSSGGSWTAGRTGRLDKVDVLYNKSAGTMDTTLHIYDGDGVLGSELYTQVVAFADSGSTNTWKTIDISGLLTLASQQQYTAYFTASSGSMSLVGSWSNIYDEGQYWQNGVNKTNTDLIIRTYLDVGTAGGWVDLH